MGSLQIVSAFIHCIQIDQNVYRDPPQAQGRRGPALPELIPLRETDGGHELSEVPSDEEQRQEEDSRVM